MAAGLDIAQGARLPLPRLRHGMQRIHESVRRAAGGGGVRRVRDGLRGARQVHGHPLLHPQLPPPRRRLRPILQVHLRYCTTFFISFLSLRIINSCRPGRVQEQEQVPLRRVHGRRGGAAAAQEGPHVLGRRRPRRTHVQDIREGEAAPAGDHRPDAGRGRHTQVEDRSDQRRHRCRLQGPRQARKDQEEQVDLPGQTATQDGAGDAQD